MGTIKSKIDAKEEAARLALASEAKDFTKKATEIYNFLVKGVELPDIDDGTALFDNLKNMYNFAPTMSHETKGS